MQIVKSTAKKKKERVLIGPVQTGLEQTNFITQVRKT